MILVTVGAQMPFDRLVRAIDAWAADRHRQDVFAQIGPGGWRPQHCRWTEFLAPSEFRGLARQARAIIAHAGMGTILSALELAKPLIVMPRRGNLRETRNDHQQATAQRFLEMGMVAVAFDEHELLYRLDELNDLKAPDRISHYASPQLIRALRNFVLAGDSAAGTAASHREPSDVASDRTP